ncbi:ribosome recycling factor family protein [Vibrio palustris]|uniref:Ribosome recycling factor n=1 Tax=Vibrio palustris TaxID=1918946 RepID=A0A1R4B6N0_9VIBR|nr:ribosome recycling factor family protein [Vibrio palustris]SJL84546.1 Ribosome recycling factor [Vibrio palustris]
MDIPLTVELRSFVQRVGRTRATQLRDMAQQHGCEMQRIRRSRHWQIQGNAQQLKQFCQQWQSLGLDTECSMVARILGELSKPAMISNEDKSAVLLQLVKENSALTIAELMAQTDCTLSEAREARSAADDDWAL